MPAHPFPLLSPLEARALAVLVEKERTVPDTYPLTLNALTAGCNQRSSRNPVFDVSESAVQAAIDTLRRYSLVIESSGGRVMRYTQNVRRVLGIPSQSLALLATLVLRGPQTAGELRINSERLNRFSDISAVEGFLREMAERPAGALVAEVARQPGARETRWMHLLGEAPPFSAQAPAAGAAAAAGFDDSAPARGAAEPHAQTPGEPREPAAPGAPSSAGAARKAGDPAESGLPASEAAALRARVAALELEVAQLRGSIESVCAELGLPSPSSGDAGQVDERAGG